MYINNNQTFLINETRSNDDIIEYKSIFNDEDPFGFKEIQTTNSGLRRIIDTRNLAYTVLEERQLTKEEMIEVREDLIRREESLKHLIKKYGLVSLFDDE